MPLETIAKPLGATPAGAAGEQEASVAVRDMFDSIAPRYDLLNHVLSANVDRFWWWRAARRFRAICANPDAAILDVCCGTGDMTMALLKHRPAAAVPILAADFAHAMLRRGARKFAAHGAIAIEADALHLPLPAASLDLVTTAFGFRNLANYRAGLAEFHRVLKPGAQLGILDFSEPGGLIGFLYRIYFERVLPPIGRILCGRDGPYNYLPESVRRFPPPAEMLALMQAEGFRDVRATAYTFGVAVLFTGTRD